ncbi:MAG: glycosyltransferase [Hyphomicrobiales bacterium]|nr:glycosyltransferase [Hyphomicrobiales bacterium]
MSIDVTFLIAAFNAEETIARAIGSALAQEGVGVEVVVVDDCSSDATAAIAGSLADKRVRVIRLDRNRGPGGARNAGLDAAGGRWIAVLDADDTVRPDRTARLLGRAAETGCEVVVDNLDMVDETAGPAMPMFARKRLQALAEMTLADFIAGNLLFEQKFSLGYMKPILRRDFLEKNALRYVEGLHIGEDYLFLASALAAGGRCAVEPEPLYAYHIRPGSISRVLELGHVEAMLEADKAFLRGHTLAPVARRAQARRTRNLRKAASYLSLVGHLKERAALKAVATAIRDPAAVRLLGMPISVRLRRVMRPFRQAMRATAE